MIEAFEITKSFGSKKVINKFTTKINDGDFISIVGNSGSGKTTLLNLLGLIETPDYGEISIDGIKNPNKKQKMLLRRNLLGYIFQNYALVENDTVESNLKIALEYINSINKLEEIRDALDYVNLSGFEKKKIYELSGGEQQRVAIARVILKKCKYIFADEPTGNLDKENSDIIFKLLKQLNKNGCTIIYVTHDIALANSANWIITL